MKTLQNIKYAIRPLLILPALALLLVTSCSKSSDPNPVDPVKPVDPPVSGSVPFYKLQRVENFAAPADDANPTAPQPTIYFSLENKQPTAANLAQTTRWDIAFSGLYNSFMSGNNGKDANNFGNGGAGAGGILILDKPFDQVTEIPADAQFRTGKSLIGTDDSGDFGEGTGWYQYDFAGTKRGDGSYEKQHVAYALPEKRTLVVRTGNGNYAKIKMISCYKDAFTVDKWLRSTPHMFFTFEYVLVPKGSTKFEIK